jgi:hypothetical protein
MGVEIRKNNEKNTLHLSNEWKQGEI